MSPTDEVLMQAVARGELRQLAELYGRYRDPLFGFLVKRTGGDRAVAEDLLQQAFERIIKYRTSFQQGQSFRAWLYTIARNLHHDHCARTDRRRVRHDAASELSDLTGEAIDVALERADTLRQGHAALAALPETYRTVIDLAWKRNLKYAEIAELLGTTENNIKVRMHRACKQLRTNYQTLEGR